MTTFYNSLKQYNLKVAHCKGNHLLITLLVLLLAGGATHAQTYPASFSQVQVVNGLSGPTAMVFAPDGRIFVTQQGGALRIIKNGVLLSTPFIQLTVDASGERGLIGIVLDPAFSTNHYVYLYHTIPGSPAHNRISRYTANGDVVLANSESVILDLDPLSSATNHNGGSMSFGTDGKLYVGVGENAFSANSQNLDTNLGKILRINADGTAPADNPFPTGSEQRKRVWAYGVRNPYTIAIQPGTGRIFINDVGEGTWEEINDATTGGLNFGWPNAEGTSTNPAYTNPVYAYQHGSGDGKGCAITGGTFFSPLNTNYPDSFIGKYFYQDFCNNWINNIDLSVSPASRSAFATGLPGNSLSILTGPDGNLYYLSISTGALYKIVYTPTTSDLTTTVLTDNLTFALSSVGTPRDFIVSITELNNISTSGTISFKIPKMSAFTITYPTTSGTSQVLGGVPNTNSQWTFSEDNNFITAQTTTAFAAKGSKIVGFRIARKTAIPANTNQNINVTIVANAGGEQHFSNNIAVTQLIAN